MSTTNLTVFERQTKTFEELICSPSLAGGLQRQSIYFTAVHILLSLMALSGNFLILVALHKESPLHPPSKVLYRCLAATDLLVSIVSQPFTASYWMSLVHEEWYLCRFAYMPTYITTYTLCLVSLLTTAAISMDRLLALLSGLRYRQIVTLKRTYCMVATFWVLFVVACLCYILDYRIDMWYSRIIIPSCLIISVASYTKIFCVLSHHQAQVQGFIQQQQNQPNALNMARYKKAVYSALWVQLVLVSCYVPIGVSGIVIASSNTYSSNLIVTWGVALVLVYFNSALNPVLYCCRIREMRQAVKQTIKQ